MGEFTLGCLLGQYDKSQSFDVDSVALTSNVNSWFAGSAVDSLGYQAGASEVHSSGQSLRIDVNSQGGGTGFFHYDYHQNNDLFERWFPEVETHQLKTAYWARQVVESSSGMFYQDWSDLPGEINHDIPYGERPGYITNEVATNSGEPFIARLRFVVRPHTGSSGIVLDDVINQVDPITLHPEFGFEEHARSIKSQHRTQGGALHTYIWDKYFAYTVPLRFLTDSHAALLNWWWENQFNLGFTLDTSDSESTYICRITNERQPIGKRIRPYQDLWQGALQLESIDRGSLVF